MTRVDFYILDTADTQQQAHFACRLVEKAWRLGHQIHLQARDLDHAKALDELLWSFKPESFLPHALAPATRQSPVHIGYGLETGVHHDLLVNFCQVVPDFFSRFQRVAEIVTQDPAALAESRERYRFYRDRGYSIENHRINLKAGT